MSNTRISVPFIKNETIGVSKLYQVSLQPVGFTIFLQGKIGWGGRGVKMIGKKQNSKNAKGDLLANGWGTLHSGGSAPPKPGFLFIFVVHRSYVGWRFILFSALRGYKSRLRFEWKGSFLKVGKTGRLINGKQFSTVYTLVDQRNDNKMFKTKEELWAAGE